MTNIQHPNFRSIIIVVILLLSAGILMADNNLTDPYEIFTRHIEAIGGLDRLKAEKTSYSESTIGLGGLTGTVKTWSMYPIYNRQEIDLNIFKQTVGDNGEYSWTVDPNGNLQIIKDPEQIKRREIQKLTADFDYLDPNSKNFTLTFRGVEKVDDKDCYVIMTNNTINSDSGHTYINTETFLIEKEIGYTPDQENSTVYSDYRQVNGMTQSFKQVITNKNTGQVVTNEVTKYESNVEIDPTMFEPPSESGKDYHFSEGNSAIDIPMEYRRNHIFIKVTIGCKERYWLLDSGAGSSVIDSAFAEELGLTSAGDLTGQGAGNTVGFSFVKVPELSLEGIEFDEQNIIAINLQSLFKKADFDAVGILGYDFLSRFVTRIDYANQTLSLYDPDEFVYDGEGEIVEAPISSSLMTVPITVDGQYSGRFRLDTGAGSTSFHYPFAKANNLHKLDGIDWMGHGAGGSFMTKAIKFKEISLAGYSVPDPIIDIPQTEVQGGFNESEMSGNIGNSLLRHFVVYLDYPNQRIIVEKGDDFEKVFDRDNSGLQALYNDDDEIEVSFVPDKTPAHKAGFKEGDIILAVNDIPVELLNGLEAFGKLRSAKPGTEYKIKIKRDGSEKELKIKLEKLYK